MTRPATLSTKPPALSRDPDFIAGSFRLVLGNSAGSFPGMARAFGFPQSSPVAGFARALRAVEGMSTHEADNDDRELDGEIERYRRAALDALGQLEWCIEYLHGLRKGEIARAISRNRRQIIERAGL